MTAPKTDPLFLNKLRDRADQPAWQRFADMYALYLRAICRRKGLGPHDSDDVVQETLLRCVLALPEFQYDPNQKFRNWVSTILSHVIIDRHRRSQGYLDSTGNSSMLNPVDLQPGREPDPSSALALQTMLEVIQGKLTEDQVRIFQLKLIDGLSDAEISRKLCKSENAVRQARHRIRDRCEALRHELMMNKG